MSRIAVAALVLLALAGCSAAPVTPAPSRPTTAVSTAAPVPSASALAVPAAGPHEIARSTFQAGSVTVADGPLPKARALYVIVRCAGDAGSTVHYALEAADGTAFGPSGDVDCNGDGVTTGQSVAGLTLPKRARVDLQPGPGATAAYAILATEPGE